MQDTTFEMEKRRNRPEKYNRELVHKTVKAMERISEVRPCRGMPAMYNLTFSTDTCAVKFLIQQQTYSRLVSLDNTA